MSELNFWVTTYLPAISTVVVAVATVVLVWLTSRYVRLTREMVEESQRSRDPSVAVDFEIVDRLIRLVIENHGLTPAKNLRIRVLKEARCLQLRQGRQGLTDCEPIKNGVSYLVPSRKLKYYLGYAKWNNVPDSEMATSLGVVYQNEAGKEYQHTVNFDFRQMREVLYESFRDSNLAVAEAIRESERDRQMREGFGQMFRAWDIGLPATKKCPMCAETIPKEAKKCAHCHEVLAQS